MHYFTLVLCLISLICNAQADKGIVGKYRSNEKYGDVWTLVLKSDSTYVFNSRVGEDIPDGKWTTVGEELILSYTSLDGSYTYTFNILKEADEMRLKGKTRPFKRMRLKPLL